MSSRRHRLLPEPFYRIVDDLDEIDLRSLRLISREANRRGRRRPFKPHRRLRVQYGPSSGFNKLPVELLYMVVNLLEDRDMISLQRVSKRMTSVTYERSCLIFDRCLRTIRTDLSSSSIAQIQYLASHPVFHHIPQALQIVPPFGPLPNIERSSSFNEIESPASIPTLKILKQLLQYSLPNCKSFELCLDSNENDHLSTDDVVQILFHLFAETERSPEQLTLYSQSSPSPETSPQDLRSLYRITAHPDISRAWTNLHTLTISEPYFQHLCWSLEFIFPLILEHAPRLERLIIIGSNTKDYNSVNALTAINKAIPMCGLKHIEIRNWEFRDHGFHDWLSANGHQLTSLTFSECATEPYQGWHDMLGDVQSYCTALESITLDNIKDSTRESRYYRTYKGTGMMAKLEELKIELRAWDPEPLAPLILY
ncbi:hypothetical protein BO94DRAFT_603097 [Aspergillus sclerotioniger CBS 115572]|uniref:F-box domain-containing protein n=1 Tax=Aspergillus sclerotioniger CBS 115572 TaxID=1450535 RepID=A0A317W5K2_9EURO|nr:hypothetical protein BO94DRAFT_603097 [Aspergillus sclerotioniger CBS 115572]PWY79430.1 hypothetical protein BO94DRAFT_603097 [Aspergillus sclerotioniger CBS 115572]